MKKIILAMVLMMFTALYANEELPQVDTSTATSSQSGNTDEDKKALEESMPKK